MVLCRLEDRCAVVNAAAKRPRLHLARLLLRYQRSLGVAPVDVELRSSAARARTRVPTGPALARTSSSRGLRDRVRNQAGGGELARLTKPGGRCGITTAKPDSALAEMFAVKTYLQRLRSPSPQDGANGSKSC